MNKPTLETHTERADNMDGDEAKQLAEHDKEIALLKQNCEQIQKVQGQIHEDVKSILTAVNGNGKPGIKTELEIAKQVAKDNIAAIDSMRNFFRWMVGVSVPIIMGLFYFACKYPQATQCVQQLPLP